jgi:plasmid stabilization system protein ParE
VTEHVVRFAPQAAGQLEALYDYIAGQANQSIAARYTADIATLCLSLERFPQRGTPRDDLFPGARSLSFKHRCTIVYTISPGGVEIAGIFYGGQDVAAAFDRG